jgi:hypothetical protein
MSGNIQTELFCPLGSKCEEVKEGKIYRCRWWGKVVGKNPQSDEYIDQWDCCISWLPMLLIENAQVTRQNKAVVEDFRNESIKRQDTFNILFANAVDNNAKLVELEEKKFLESKR